MKKLLSILLAVAMVMALALPSIAAETPFELEFTTNEVTAVNFGANVVKDEIYDEETKEFIGYGPEWTCYSWYKYCMVDVTLNGESLHVSLDNLSGLFSDGRYGNIGGGIQDSQNAQTPWEIGGTYDAKYYIFDHETGETIWETDLKVTLVEPVADVQLSKITVDELSGYPCEDGQGNTYKEYDWQTVGVVDATIDGSAYKGIGFGELKQILNDTFGEVNMMWSNSYNTEDGDPFDQKTNHWEVGDTFELELTITSDVGYLFADTVTIEVCPTNIASVSAKPVTYYAHNAGLRVEMIATYKDNTTGPCDLNYEFKEEEQMLPTEPGTYTIDIIVANIFEVPVQVTVLATPTSGKLGENVSWAYDAQTATLTVSGTGDTYYMDESIIESSDEFNDWVNDWCDLLVYFKPKHIVVEEDVTGLMPGIFLYSIAAEDISLPATLKQMADGMFGLNGPSDSVNLGFDVETTGLTTFVLPKSIKAWDQHSFYQCWGITDIYLPAGLTSVTLDNLVCSAWMRDQLGVEAVETTIHFAGTEEQWNAVKLLAQDVDETEYNPLMTGLTLEEAKEYLNSFKITFEDPAASYVEDESEDVITIPDTSVEIVDGKDVVIDVSTKENVSAVVIGSETVDKITDAETAVEIKLPDATVSFDKTAIGSIGAQAGEAAVTIVAKEVEDSTLTTEQKSALEEKEVLVYLSLEAHAGETKITDFGGGKVTVSVPFELPEGKFGADYYVAYVAADGTITVMPTTYADGMLTFETTHFSNYVVLEKEIPVNDNPKTGDNQFLGVFALLMVVAAAGMLCVTKRRAF